MIPKESEDRNTPKKPKPGLDYVFNDFVEVYRYCPSCDNYLVKAQKYCDECGQAIDWSDVE